MSGSHKGKHITSVYSVYLEKAFLVYDTEVLIERLSLPLTAYFLVNNQ